MRELTHQLIFRVNRKTMTEGDITSITSPAIVTLLSPNCHNTTVSQNGHGHQEYACNSITPWQAKIGIKPKEKNLIREEYET